MKTKVFGIIIWIIPTFIFAQNSIEIKESGNNINVKGIILEEENKIALAYSSIGIPNTPVGTISDTSGKFSLIIDNIFKGDTLQISLIGYESKRIPIRELINSEKNTIILKTKSYLLNEVVISSRQNRPNVVGREGIGQMVQFSFHNKDSKEATLGSEMGVKIKSKKYPAKIKNFNWHISANNFDNIKYRINIYSLKNNMPDTLILNREIYANVTNFKTGWNTIDIEPYNVNVNGDFVVTLQWIESNKTKKGNPITIIPGNLSLFHTSYFRIACQDKWMKVGANLSYNVTLLY